jgi:hypothetical protein
VSAGGPLDDSGQSVGTDQAGNVYIAGNVGGTLSDIDTDAYVAKYSSDGDIQGLGVLQWSRVFSGRDALGNSFGDSANAIAVDPAGNSYVAGDFRGTLDFGNNIVLTSTGAIDGFVMKLDTSGTVQWVHQLASNGNYGPYTYDRLGTLAPKGIALDYNADKTVLGVVVTGFFNGTMDMDPANPGVHMLTSENIPAGSPGSYVVKLDAGGNYVWKAQADGASGATSFAVAVDDTHNVYTIGGYGNKTWFNDKTDDMTQPNLHSIIINGANLNSLYVRKLTGDGKNVWVQTLATQTQGFKVFGLGMAIDHSGNIYSTGEFAGGSLSFQGTTLSSPNAAVYNGFIDKIDKNGNLKWAQPIASSGDNSGTGIAIGPNGHAYVTGYITADSLLGNILLTPTSSAGNSFIAELNPAGHFLCAQKSLDLDPDGDKAAAIAVDGQGFVDITGAFSTQMQWPSLPLLTNTTANDETDIFTIKTQLTCSPCTHVQTTTVLTLTAVNHATIVNLTDDVTYGVRVQIDNDAPLVY